MEQCVIKKKNQLTLLINKNKKKTEKKVEATHFNRIAKKEKPNNLLYSYPD